MINEWDYVKNQGINPEEIQPKSSRNIWWRCKNGHSWNSTVAARTSDLKICPSCQSLGFLRPDILNEWDYEKNLLIDPFLINKGSHQKKWWKCSEGHSWLASLSNRTGSKRSGCPRCANVIRIEKMRVSKIRKSDSD